MYVKIVPSPEVLIAVAEYIKDVQGPQLKTLFFNCKFYSVTKGAADKMLGMKYEGLVLMALG